VEVQDQGVGIPEENLKRILDPFFTTKQDTGGTGLGLSISYNIVKNHGGDLAISSLPGQGTTAVVSLPLPPEAVGA
jgi:polar amino acid transport system substrate-binding protein